MKVIVDADKCTGHGRCYSLEPAIFTDDDWGHGAAIGDGEISQDQVESARRAVAACPEKAISLID